jgi:hypothetical protein
VNFCVQMSNDQESYEQAEVVDWKDNNHHYRLCFKATVSLALENQEVVNSVVKWLAHLLTETYKIIALDTVQELKILRDRWVVLDQVIPPPSFPLLISHLVHHGTCRYPIQGENQIKAQELEAEAASLQRDCKTRKTILDQDMEDIKATIVQMENTLKPLQEKLSKDSKNAHLNVEVTRMEEDVRKHQVKVSELRAKRFQIRDQTKAEIKRLMDEALSLIHISEPTRHG